MVSVLSRIINKFSGESYQARAYRGTMLVAVRMAGQNGIRLAGNLVLTRILFPEAFGLMALVTVVLMAAQSFSDVGINPAILQHKRGHDPKFLNTAWTMQIARGVVLWLAILLLSGPIARFYEAPQLAELLLVSAFVPLMQGFTSTKVATARREIQLERVIALELIGQVLGLMVMIVLSYWLQSVWGLVLGTLVRPAFVAVTSHIALKGVSNRIAFEREALRALAGFGKYIFFATIAGFFVLQGDRAVLGKYVSLDDLAIFNIGFFLASVPRLLTTAVSDAVVYPLYARRPPAESESNRKKINGARILMTGGMVLAIAVLALIGDWLVRFLYDARYYAAGPILVAISLGSLPVIILQSYQMMPLAYGHSGRYASFIILRAAIYMGTLLLTVPTYGMWGAAIAPGLSAIISYPVMIWAVRPYKGWDPVHDMVYFALAAALVGLMLWVHGDLLGSALATL